MSLLRRAGIRYPIIALLLSLGAPVGYFIVRAVSAGVWPVPELVEVEIRERLDAYAYMALSTAVVFIAIARRVGREHDVLQSAALTDALTGLPNRRQLHERAYEMLVRDKLDAVSVLLVDLDGLKAINDHEGHASGDRALSAVADSLRHVCRREDAFGRYGGDEFLVLLPRTNAVEAKNVAERICHTMTSHRGLSVSVGVTDVQRAGSNVLRELIEAADGALARAKANGKNRAELSEVTP